MPNARVTLSRTARVHSGDALLSHSQSLGSAGVRGAYYIIGTYRAGLACENFKVEWALGP